MKIIRFQDPQGQIGWARQNDDGSAHRIAGDLFGDWNATDEIADVAKILAPVAPTAILCIGLNYRQHAAEGGKPVPQSPILFVKSPGAVQNPGDPIELPTHLRAENVDYECELAVVIGRKCKNATRENALDFVLGYTGANDVSARDWQNDSAKSGGQWCRAKTFDTFCPLGPVLVTPDDIPDPNALAIKTVLNGQTMQDWNTRDMIFDVPTLIEFLSGSTTLWPGTVILTGTPHGVGMARKPPVWLQEGDVVTVEIERIGALTNSVVRENAG